MKQWNSRRPPTLVLNLLERIASCSYTNCWGDNFIENEIVNHGSVNYPFWFLASSWRIQERPRLKFFSVREFFIFKLKESHAPENVPKTICCMYAPSHKQMFLMQFRSRSSTWVTVMSKCHLLVIVVGGIKTRLCFSVVWRKNLDKVSGTRRKNCQLL